jgi:hypothetical protein
MKLWQWFQKRKQRPFVCKPQAQRSSLRLEHLEERTAPAVQLLYGGAGTQLTLTELVAGATPVVNVSDSGSNSLTINLNGGHFDASSTTAAAGLTYQVPGNPAASSFATVDIGAVNNISTLQTNLVGDTLDLGTISDNVGGVGNINSAANAVGVVGVVNTSNASAGSGSIGLNATTSVSVQAPGGLTTKDGNITVLANQNASPVSGNFTGILVNQATIQTTGAGNLLLQGTGGNDAASAAHQGILVEALSTIQSTGSGTLTLTGRGGVGTDSNAGVAVIGAAATIQSASSLQITGSGGSTSGGIPNGTDNFGVEVVDGAQLTATGGLTINGTGGSGSGFDVGVRVDGRLEPFALIASSAFVKIVGTAGTGGGLNEGGVLLLGGAEVTATGAAPITIVGTGGTNNQNDFGVDIGDQGADGQGKTAVTSATGAITITGTGGVFFSPGLYFNTAAKISSSSGAITLASDSMSFATTCAINTPGVVVLEPVTPGAQVILGSSDSTGPPLALTNFDLSIITAGTYLQIGSAATGLITISTPISAPAGWITLALVSSAGVVDNNNTEPDITVTNLAVSTANGISLDTAVTNLALRNTSAGTVRIANTAALTITTVGTIAGATSNGGDINITASTATSGMALTVSQPIDTTSTANITLTADRMTLGAAINAHAGIVSLFPTTIGRNIDLGTNANAADLGLLQTDLNNVTAGILRIRSVFASNGFDSITVTAPITDVGTGWSTLSVVSGPNGTFTENAGDTLTVVNLLAAGMRGVTLTQNNVVSTLAGASRLPFNFTDTAASLALDTVDDVLGFGSGIIGSGPVTLTLTAPGATLTVNQAIDTTRFLGTGSNINLTADAMTFNAAVNAVTQQVTLLPTSTTRPFDLGTKTAGTLGLTDSDLDMVAAGLLQIGSTSDTGTMTVSNTIDSETHYSTLALATGDAIVQGASGKLQVPSLVLRALTGIGNASALVTVVSNLDFNNSFRGAVQVSNAGALTITTLGVLTPPEILNADAVTLTAAGPLTFAVDTFSSGPLTATTSEAAAGSDDITVNSRVSVDSTAAGVLLQAGDNLLLQTGSVVGSFNGNAVLIMGFNDSDSDGGSMVIAGTVRGTMPTIIGGSGSGVNALLVDFANGAFLPNGLTFHGNAAGNDTMTLSGTSVSTAYTLTAASAARDPTSIGFSNLGNVNVKAGDQADVFNVTASPTTAFFLDGGPPSTTPGDALNLDAGGSAVTVGSGTYTVQGDKPVTIINIETVHMSNAAAIGGFAGPDTADRNQLMGLTPTQRFVQVLYLDALGRPGSMAELNSWVSVYNSSGANAQNVVITSIERSSEARDHLVKSWYKAFLGRSAAAGEEMGWVNMLLGGSTEETVLANILGTQEFFNRAQTLVASGSANERYVQALYQLLLGRSGSASEVSGQAALIATVGRAGVAQGLLSSGEYRTNLTNAYYEILLHRVPSAAEVAGWLNLNLDQDTQRVDIETSIEFFNNG